MIPLMAVVTSLSFATTSTCARSYLPHCSGPPRFRGGVPVLYQEVEEEQERGFPLPFLQKSVPKGQQPSQDALRRQAFAKWPESDEYNSKMQGLYFFISLIFSLPVSFVTFDQLPQELPQLLIAANIGTLGFLVLFVGRLRLAWAEVSSRLKAKSTYYEANQRGNLARKEREELLRDQLTQKEYVAPVLRRLDVSLIQLALGLALTLGAGEAVTVIEGEAGPATLKTLTGDDAVRFTNRLRSDEDFAAREQERGLRRMQEDGSGVKPGYCDSRYYKILAGGNGQGGVGCS